MTRLPEALDLLENSTFFEVLLCVISGKDYSSAIAKALKKSQPTVTEQLKQLEAARLIKALNRKKAQAYEVNWDLLFEIFYDVVYDAIALREEYLEKDELKRITRTSLEGIIPRNMFKKFLIEYFSTLQDLGGKRKGLDEIILSFFLAMEKLNKRDWKKLLSKFGSDENNLATIANAVGYEVFAIEQTALIMLLDNDETGK